MRAAVLTISTSVARGQVDDRSGQLLADALVAAGAEVVAREVVPDDREPIEAGLRAQVAAGVELILTTGGTGLTPDDVTPEATRAVIERDAPGFAEALRAESLRRTPLGMLSRGAAGIAGRSLIVNLPGSPRAVGELFAVLAPTLQHVSELLQREPGPGDRGERHRIDEPLA